MSTIAKNKVVNDYNSIQLPNLPFVPGMISENEAKYLYRLTGEVYTGNGAVVEVGTWLGKSSAHLGAGLRDSKTPSTLYCHDLYSWHRNFNAPHLVKQSGLELEHGTDFQPYFEKNVRPIYDNLVVAKGPLERIVWKGGPIEILFIDAPKDQASICALLEIFANHLIPGVSTVVMQDFLHAPSYPLALVFSELSDELEFVHAVPKSSTAVFHVRKKLAIKRNEKRFNFQNWKKEKTLKAWNSIIDKLPKQPRDYLEPGVALSLFNIGEIEEACNYIQALDLGADGQQRWEFLRSVPQYYQKYQPIFDCYFDSSLAWRTGGSLRAENKFQRVDCSVELTDDDSVQLESLKGGVAIMDWESVQRNQVVIEVDVSFSNEGDNGNGFVIFGDHSSYQSRVCVGVYASKNELWIEEHPSGVYGVKQVRKKLDIFGEDSKSGGKMSIFVNLQAKTIELNYAGQTIRSTFENHLGGLRWFGYRVYNTKTKFGPMIINSLGPDLGA